MGNWRTVDMRGRIAPEDVADIRRFLSNDRDCGDAWCFTISLSLCGLNDWINDDGSIDTSGNLYERDFDNDDIEKALRVLAERYPSLELTLHSGSDWEELECSATFHVKDGVVRRCAPEVEKVRPIVGIWGSEYLKRVKEGLVQAEIKKEALVRAHDLMNVLEQIDDGDFVDAVLAAVANCDEITLDELSEELDETTD